MTQVVEIWQGSNVLSVDYNTYIVDLIINSAGLSKGSSGLEIVTGSGIQIGSGGIENTGVLSFQGSTGAINLTAGNGIGITGLTLVNTGVLTFGGVAGNISLGSVFALSSNTLNINLASNITINGSNQLQVNIDNNYIIENSGNLTLNLNNAFNWQGSHSFINSLTMYDNLLIANIGDATSSTNYNSYTLEFLNSVYTTSLQNGTLTTGGVSSSALETGYAYLYIDGSLVNTISGTSTTSASYTMPSGSHTITIKVSVGGNSASANFTGNLNAISETVTLTITSGRNPITKVTYYDYQASVSYQTGSASVINTNGGIYLNTGNYLFHTLGIQFDNNGTAISWQDASLIYDNGQLNIETDDHTYFNSFSTGTTATWEWYAGTTKKNGSGATGSMIASLNGSGNFSVTGNITSTQFILNQTGRAFSGDFGGSGANSNVWLIWDNNGGANAFGYGTGQVDYVSSSYHLTIGSVNQISDSKMKVNFTENNTSILNDFINIKHGNWSQMYKVINQNGIPTISSEIYDVGNRIGILADTIPALYTEQSKDSGIYSLNSEKMYAMFTKAIQELIANQKQIASKIGITLNY